MKLVRMQNLGLVLAVLALSLAACSREDRGPSTAVEQITIAYTATTDAPLAKIAQAKGFFRQQGLQPVSRLFTYGKPALEDLLAGHADFATVAETPVMFAIMKGEQIAIIATIQSSKMSNAVLGRRDRGIRFLGDLKGKRVGVTPGTTSDFFLDAILALEGVSRKDVQVVDLKAEAMADALARGEIDAASVFTPYTVLIRKQLGERAIVFQDRGIYRTTYNVVARQDYIRKNPEKVRKVLRALVKAEGFAVANPEQAQQIVAQFSSLEPGVVRDAWADNEYMVTLDQALVLALEDESEWAIQNGLTDAHAVPNFLNHIYRDGLLSVAPKTVRILK